MLTAPCCTDFVLFLLGYIASMPGTRHQTNFDEQVVQKRRNMRGLPIFCGPGSCMIRTPWPHALCIRIKPNHEKKKKECSTKELIQYNRGLRKRACRRQRYGTWQRIDNRPLWRILRAIRLSETIPSTYSGKVRSFFRLMMVQRERSKECERVRTRSGHMIQQQTVLAVVQQWKKLINRSNHSKNWSGTVCWILLNDRIIITKKIRW